MGGIGSEAQGRLRGAVEVRGDEFGLSTGRVDLLDHLGAALGAASTHDDVRSFARERGGDRAADVAGSSLQPHANPHTLALSTFAALHGGLLLTQMMESIEPLEAALDGALTVLRNAATTSPG